MKMPAGEFTISEAAAVWISMIQSSNAPEAQKNAMVEQIEAAAPQTIGMAYGVGHVQIKERTRFCFADATNAIKRVMRGETR